jgi:hypothetical protein
LPKLKKASSPQELAKMAHEAGIRLSDSDADYYFAELHQGEKELSEDELSDVSGGSCSTAEDLSKKYVVTPGGAVCSMFELTIGTRCIPQMLA